jgi:hypothetical protein
MSRTPAESTSSQPSAQKSIPLFLDKEGKWFHEGIQITHVRTVELFSRSLVKETDGGYSIKIGSEYSRVQVEDTPYMVTSLSVQHGETGKPCEYLLRLNDGRKEFLDPGTLTTNSDNVLYCRVRNGTEKARFLRPAYYDFCSHIEVDEKGVSYWLPWRGRRFHLGCL